MDKMLRRVVKENGLTAIGVNMHTGHFHFALPFTVYVHWAADDGCKSGNGKTVAEAIECALGEMREFRAAQEDAQEEDA
jgi:hypothetical protein